MQEIPENGTVAETNGENSAFTKIRGEIRVERQDCGAPPIDSPKQSLVSRKALSRQVPSISCAWESGNSELSEASTRSEEQQVARPGNSETAAVNACPASPRSDTQNAVTTLAETLLGPGGALVGTPLRYDVLEPRASAEAAEAQDQQIQEKPVQDVKTEQ